MGEFVFLGFLAEIFGQREARIPLEGPRRLREVLGALRFPEERAIVLINQRVGDFDSIVTDGDKVTIMPVISGG